MSILSAENLSKKFKFKEVVKGISFEINSGEVVGLLGPNGAGKTTAFYMVVGLVAADKGKVILDGKDVTPLPMHQRARLGIGYLPQEASIFRKLSVAKNIMAILQTRNELSRADRERILEELLEELHISHVRNSLGLSLSGGERRRVEIARALAVEPRFILLDEPFAGVDPISILDIQRIIKHLSERGIGVLITDHNVRETLGICNRAYIVNQGAVIASGSPDEVLDNQHVREVYLGDSFKL
ncbi:MAG: LPS export ABC transporter ATP-binding protein [Gammaproteobacteria bacterium]|nr:LPS export ABC transporter ATP-binding protein [Gammaproteobacteria bacterium]MCP4088579.1 LPS export ABC transporter ATP-binding protein [Gammaproteobacteria bacterium]MCP4276513.1 LPS export ABC transporter ATP-binding protein [Gammaproteobacteria bacterium]MCP4832390.1 LPS export ABC transporter ATP-binding protein [Gammaproteobacteria bacterium]MCP4929096.1 LPS export ABC transporter ATP-binding protein [Gammaproteobacteria bacterium]